MQRIHSVGSPLSFLVLLGAFALADLAPAAVANTPLTVSITAPADGSTVRAIVTVSANASNNVKGVQFQLDGVNLGSEDTSSPFTVSWDTTTASNGSHKLSAVARDAAGKRKTSATISSIIVDNQPPTGSVIINNGAAVTINTATTLTLSASDTQSAVTQMRFSNNGSTFSTAQTFATTAAWTLTTGDGAKTVFAQFKDAAGNWSSAVISATIVLDTTPPTISSVASSGIDTSNATITWTTNDPASSQVNYGLTTSYGATTALDSNRVTAHSVSLSGLSPNMTYNFRVRSLDTVGNETVSANATFITRALPPTVTISAVPASVLSGQSSTLTWSSTNATSCTASGAWSGSQATAGSLVVTNLTTTGTYTLTCTGAGAAIQSATITVTFGPDTTAPSTPGNLAATAVSTSAINLAWTPSTDPVVPGQATAGVLGYKVFRNGTNVGVASSSSHSDTGLTASTLYSYTVAAVDAAGNVSTPSNVANATTLTAPTTGTAVSDNFNRADGGLGANWTTMAGPLAPKIAGNLLTVPAAEQASLHSAYWTGNSFANDQFVQARMPNSGTGAGSGPGLMVRAANSRGYFLWYGNSANQVTLWRMDGPNSWGQIGGSTNNLTITPATDVWRLEARGSIISAYQNGNLVAQTADTTYGIGSAGVWMYYAANQIDDWSAGDLSPIAGPPLTVGGTVSGLTGTLVLQNNGGSDITIAANGSFGFASAYGSSYAITMSQLPAGETCKVLHGNGVVVGSDVADVAVICTPSSSFTVQFVSIDANGVETYTINSVNNGLGTQSMRVLRPISAAPGMSHNILYVLPVEGGGGSGYGDGLATLQALGANDAYNLTILEPTFSYAPWFADSDVIDGAQYETFMVRELQPWVTANLSTSGKEQHWLIGFSKSGIGGMDLLLKHPDVFTLGAAWDWPANMASYLEFGANANYGTEANFQRNYRLTSAFVDTHKTAFLTNNRIWINGYALFQTDVEDFDVLLTSKGIQHTTAPEVARVHRWDSGWVQHALDGLHQQSMGLPN